MIELTFFVIIKTLYTLEKQNIDANVNGNTKGATDLGVLFPQANAPYVSRTSCSNSWNVLSLSLWKKPVKSNGPSAVILSELQCREREGTNCWEMPRAPSGDRDHSALPCRLRGPASCPPRDSDPESLLTASSALPLQRTCGLMDCECLQLPGLPLCTLVPGPESSPLQRESEEEAG